MPRKGRRSKNRNNHSGSPPQNDRHYSLQNEDISRLGTYVIATPTGSKKPNAGGGIQVKMMPNHHPHHERPRHGGIDQSRRNPRPSWQNSRDLLFRSYKFKAYLLRALEDGRDKINQWLPDGEKGAESDEDEMDWQPEPTICIVYPFLLNATVPRVEVFDYLPDPKNIPAWDDVGMGTKIRSSVSMASGVGLTTPPGSPTQRASQVSSRWF